MPDLILVRHAQASFGSDDYDRLSALGHLQARWLGEYFAERGWSFDRVMTGTLRRHRETLQGIVAGGARLGEPIVHPGLDEYDPQRLLRGWLANAATAPPAAPAPAAAALPGADHREHFRVLRRALDAWVAGELDVPDHRTFAAFRDGARTALHEARADPAARRVLVVSSGGPISTLVCDVLRADPRSVVDLNLQLRNTGVCELAYGGRAVRVVAVNAVPHLDRADRREHVTHA